MRDPTPFLRRKRRLRAFATGLLMGAALAAAGCAPEIDALSAGIPDRPSALSGVPTLTLLDAVVLPPAPPGDNARRFGSLSGLVFDPRAGRYLGVIDDRQPSRVAWIDVSFEQHLSVRPVEVIPIEPSAGVDPIRVTAADLEAIVALPDGTFVAAEEGHISTGLPGQPPAGRWPPALLTLSPTMTVTHIDEWPAMFEMGPEAGGVRNNQSVESLARTPDGRLIAGLEQPRYADLAAIERNGRPYGGGTGGPGRLVEFLPSGDGWRARRQWLYPIAPTTLRPGFEAICNDGENGLSDLLALDDVRFLALERACLLNEQSRLVRNTAQLYLVDVSAADDVSGLQSLRDARVRGAAKTLVLDFDSLIPRLPSEVSRLDNFEGLAWGPRRADGGRTLLVVSDDNFRSTQRTIFLLFAVQ